MKRRLVTSAAVAALLAALVAAVPMQAQGGGAPAAPIPHAAVSPGRQLLPLPRPPIIGRVTGVDVAPTATSSR